MRTKRQIQQIVKEVQTRLDARRNETGLALAVEKNGYTQDDNWLHVVVSPTKNGIRAYDYVEALSDVERELREAGIEQVVLVPALE